MKGRGPWRQDNGSHPPERLRTGGGREAGPEGDFPEDAGGRSEEETPESRAGRECRTGRRRPRQGRHRPRPEAPACVGAPATSSPQNAWHPPPFLPLRIGRTRGDGRGRGTTIRRDGRQKEDRSAPFSMAARISSTPVLVSAENTTTGSASVRPSSVRMERTRS